MPISKLITIFNRLEEVNTNFVESFNDIRPMWKRFEPKMEALEEAVNEFQTTSDGNKSKKRNRDGAQVNGSKYFSSITRATVACIFPFPTRFD